MSRRRGTKYFDKPPENLQKLLNFVLTTERVFRIFQVNDVTKLSTTNYLHLQNLCLAYHSLYMYRETERETERERQRETKTETERET